MLVAGIHPPALVAATGAMSAETWALAFTIGAGIALIGVLWRAPIGWALELGGRVPLGVTALGYTVVLVDQLTSVGAAIVVAIVGATGVASLVRAVALTIRLHRYRRAVDMQRGRQ